MACHKSVLLLALFAFVLGVSPDELQVTTTQGVVQGLLQDHTDTTGVKFRAFLGIPYADTPVRFQLAKPRTPWTGVLLAHKDGPACPQPTKTPSSEDCLYLNVFTPQDTVEGRELPVMVFLHGSAFTYSSSYSLKYGPDFFIPHNVILVTLNYRLGPLGFLTLGNNLAPGNMGLHDSLLALHWVQSEIRLFGGDPAKVTLFGQSAGAAMTLFHYLSPISAGKGLFRYAIAESGSALAPWASYTPTEGARRARQLARQVGCDITLDDLAVLECLRSADIETLVNSTYIPVDDLVTGYFPFVPVIDDDLSDSPFFGNTLENLMERSVQRAIPLVTGFTSQDGIVLIDQAERWRRAGTQLPSFIPLSTKSKTTLLQQACFAQQIRDHYFSDSSGTDITDLINLFTDTSFAVPAIQVALALKDFTYGYLFAYNGSWKIVNNYFSQFNITGMVPHGSELPYLFTGKGNQTFDDSKENTINLRVKNSMVQMWVDFAKTGVPSSTWKTVSTGDFLLINSTLSQLPLKDVEAKHYDFWTNMINQDEFSLPSVCFNDNLESSCA